MRGTEYLKLVAQPVTHEELVNMVQDRDNQQWIEALQADGPPREAAPSDLQWLLLWW